MFEAFAHQLVAARGRYPVANLIHDHLKVRAGGHRGFRLGEWLACLELEVLEDVQVKLEAMLHGGGPDHAGEDLIVAVDLLSRAERGGAVELSDQDIKMRLVCWFEAGSLEKLSRAGLVLFTGDLSSIDPALRHQTGVQVTAEALSQVRKG